MIIQTKKKIKLGQDFFSPTFAMVGRRCLFLITVLYLGLNLWYPDNPIYYIENIFQDSMIMDILDTNMAIQQLRSCDVCETLP